MTASGPPSTLLPSAIRCRPRAWPGGPVSIPPPSTSRSGCPRTAGRAGRRPNRWPRSSRRRTPRSTSSPGWSRAAPRRGAGPLARAEFVGAAARLRPGRRRRLLRRCRLPRRAGLGSGRASGAARRESSYALQVQGDSMLPLYRNGDVLIVEPGAVTRKGDRVVVKTNAGEVMAKVLDRQTTKIDRAGLAQSRPPGPRHRHARCRVGGAHRLGKPVGAAMLHAAHGCCWRSWHGGRWSSLAAASCSAGRQRRRRPDRRETLTPCPRSRRPQPVLQAMPAEPCSRIPGPSIPSRRAAAARAGGARAGRAARAAERAGAGRAAEAEDAATTGTERRCSSRSRPPPDLIEAKGYSVAVAGIDIVRQDETCSDDGKSWACGIAGAHGVPRLSCAAAPWSARCRRKPTATLIAADAASASRMSAMAGREWLGARCGRRPLCRSGRQGARRARRASSAPPPISAACRRRPACRSPAPTGVAADPRCRRRQTCRRPRAATLTPPADPPAPAQ